MKFTRIQLIEIKKKRRILTNKQLYDHLTVNFKLNTGYTSFRTALYNLGLKKCSILRWTESEKKFLLENYRILGNIEIAKNLSKPGRIFTKKNIEKKIKLLKIKRTPEELLYIKDKNKAKGIYKEASARIKEKGIRYYPEGHVKIQIMNDRPVVVIKVNGIFVHYMRYRYKQIHGDIPEGWKVYPKDYNFRNIADENLICKHATGIGTSEREKYKHFYRQYFAEIEAQNPKIVKLEKPPVPEEPAQTLIAVRIGKMVVKVKPGTDIGKLKEKYEMRNTPSNFRLANANMKINN
ncbi:hypothetical protein [Chryseobacterium flavum]|uniref:hypothetical protein n=1 Tax=Chryseobacterium flavum TaxID=415851 RepID=UPI0028A8F03F|nr:hypothetical protein [Chryseobacterium flavum]